MWRSTPKINQSINQSIPISMNFQRHHQYRYFDGKGKAG
jgi:hypothetical protein